MKNNAYILDLIDLGTPSGIIIAGALLFFGAWLACFLTTWILERQNNLLEKFRRKVDITFYRYFIRIKNVLIFIIAAFVYSTIVPGIKNLLAPVLASAGAIALIGGFAAKSTIANYVAGLLIAFYQPVKIGDKIEIDGQYYTVEEITLRHTIGRSLQNIRILIPNSKLDEMILVNYSIIDPRILCVLKLGVSYDTDIDLARRLILEEAENCPYKDSKAEKPLVRVISHEDFSIGLRLYLWVPAPDDIRSARFWLLEKIKKRFDTEGIEIPFPYRTLVYKKDLPSPPREESSDI
ncbi:mechanosensitive ion channel family protein [Thermodesulfobacteriota bacterium]